MRMIQGSKLDYVDQQHVLAAYVHRFTGQHRPAWAKRPMPSGKRYKVQFKDDADWLANTKFAVRQDGRLDMRVHRCESTPTWPEGK